MSKIGRIASAVLTTAAVTGASVAGGDNLAIAVSRVTLTCMTKSAPGGAAATDDRRLAIGTVRVVGERAA